MDELDKFEAWTAEVDKILRDAGVDKLDLENFDYCRAYLNYPTLPLIAANLAIRQAEKNLGLPPLNFL